MRTALLSLACAASLLACGGGEALAPLAGLDGGLDAGLDSGAPPADAGALTVKRTVTQRNPLGGRPGNLLVDGDFEMSTEAQAGSQLGVRAYSSDGSAEVLLTLETGGLCRSGLRCAVLPSATVLFMRGTSPLGKAGVASAWAKLPDGAKCSQVKPILIDCDTFDVGKQLVAEQALTDGWCHYSAALDASDMSTCVYVESSLVKGKTALVDDFVLAPDDGTIVPQQAIFWAPEADLVARLAALRETVRRGTLLARPPRRPPPSP
jgi:hypothetical protein